MISRIVIENFNGVPLKELVFQSGVFAAYGAFGPDRTCMFDVLHLLMSIARGVATPAISYGMLSDVVDARITVYIKTTRYGEIVYSCCMRQRGMAHHISSEELVCRGETFLERTNDAYWLNGNQRRFGIDGAAYALGTAMPFLLDDPVSAMKNELSKVLTISPDPLHMASFLVADMMPQFDVGLINLASYIVHRQQANPVIYGAMMDRIRAMMPAFSGFSVEQNSLGRQYLAVHHSYGWGPRGIPFELVDRSEKMLVLAAFIGTVNEYVEPLCVAWDSPLNWFGVRDGQRVFEMLLRSFLGRGQLFAVMQGDNPQKG